jgi:hypothetical protein
VVWRLVAGWMIGGSSPGTDWEFFSSVLCPGRFWGLPILLSGGYLGVGLAALFHQVARLGGGCVELCLHSPNMHSWRGAQLKDRDNFTFTLIIIIIIIIMLKPFDPIPRPNDCEEVVLLHSCIWHGKSWHTLNYHRSSYGTPARWY